MNVGEESVALHEKLGGKIEVISRAPLKTAEDLSLLYTPGVAQPCLEIQKDPDKVWTLTRRNNLIAVITDGSAVLGLGNIGPQAGMPVMEGKCLLFKELGGVDAFPLCVSTQDPDEFIAAVEKIADSFGGINLEDISAPRCFEIEKKLQEKLDIPVFHDDQHGTAISNLLMEFGFTDVLLCDRAGILSADDPSLSPAHRAMAEKTNADRKHGTLADALKGADVFVGVSAPGIVTKDMVASMNKDAIVFALANPTPEIMPDLAKEAGAAVVATGRSDFPNQVNNVMAFPGIFRGALDVRAREINREMKLAAAYAIAGAIPENELSREKIVLNPLDKRIFEQVSEAVRQAARATGAARL